MLIPKIARHPEDTPLTRFLRIMGLLGIFVLAGVIYWHYYEHSIDTILAKQSIWDQTKTLTSDQKKAIQSFGRMLRSRYGIDLRLNITKDPVILPTLNAKTLFLGICPARQEVTIIFPPLVRSALGKGFEDHLARKHFTPYWKEGDWPRGLGSALALIGERLQGLSKYEPDN
ncbi:MAG: hypothetical protein CSA21_03805 [Deltaproteobacteria bacterium]|nr:MAG: hypothetical protein CSA21_03805 [Deltaproteobacteria bacterium]